MSRTERKKTEEYRRSKVKMGKSDIVLYTIVTFFMILVLLVVIYPLIFVLSCSFSSGIAVSSGRIILWPVDLSIKGYRVVLNYKLFWTGFFNTVLYTVAGTALNLFLTIMCAYPLSKRKLQGKRLYMTYFMITMFISGGLIPTYILHVRLGLYNNRWAIILSGGLSVYNMIIMRTFFQNSIPYELSEAAKMDGCSDFRYLLNVVLPLSKPIIAIITMYYAVAHWNSYYTEMIYLRNPNLYSLQQVMRNVLKASNVNLKDITDPELIAEMSGLTDVMKYAMIVVAVIPILMVYPFIQKYFQKGVMIGSVKG